ncbi:MAG: AAA family ATPase, partial [Hymenobacter sp.]
VHEQLPVAEARLVLRPDSLIELTTLLDGQQHVAVVGNPGMGKSWLLHQAAIQLKQAGWAVAVHYCFIDLLDVDREARASINTMFGSLIAELREVLPQVSHSDGPRFAAGAATLETLLAEAQQRVPAQRIALIVDGIDHVDRIGNQATGASSRLILELANLRLPPGVALIIGSQPGQHLQEFPFQDSQLRLSRWPDELLRSLLEQTELRQVYHNAHRTADTERLLTTITEKAGGSPLYATYLVKTALTHVRDAGPLTATGTPVVDIAAYLATLPAPDVDLHNYYRWLLDGLAAGTRAWWVAELLALLDFPVSAIELKEINPGMAHQVQRALSCLAPVLSEETAYGGLRIYHESFQRYVRQVLRDDDADSAALLQPVIQWLGKRGFYADLRAFRHLPSLLRAAGRLPDMLALVDDDFVAKAAANGQPADAVLAVLTIVAEAAADQLAWPELTRLVELARAATNLYYERLPGDDMAEQYGRAYATLHGADALAARLLYDGRCTFPVESGLVLCQLCDQQTGSAPWSEYLALLAQQVNKEYGLR